MISGLWALLDEPSKWEEFIVGFQLKLFTFLLKKRFLKYADISIEFTCTGKSYMFPLISTIRQGFSCWKGLVEPRQWNFIFIEVWRKNQPLSDHYLILLEENVLKETKNVESNNEH